MDTDMAKPFKVTNSLRTLRKGVVASSLEELSELCKVKFSVEAEISDFVLEEDGTEVDRTYFKTLPPNTVLMMLVGEEDSWVSSNETTAVARCSEASDRRVMDIMDKIRGSRSKKLTPAPGSRKPTMSVLAGWQTYHFKHGRFIIMKSSAGHPNLGPRSVSFSRDANLAEVLRLLMDVFFPNGKNSREKLKDNDCWVGNSRGEKLDGQGFRLGDYVDQSSTLKPRIYLLTKEKVRPSTQSSESESDLPDLSPIIRPHAPSTATSSSTYSPPTTPGLDRLPPISTLTSTPSTTPNTTDSRPTPTWRDAGTPTVSIRSSTQKCPVCLIRERDSFTFPCGHPLCSECGAQIVSRGQCCPTCRQPIWRINQIYM